MVLHSPPLSSRLRLSRWGYVLAVGLFCSNASLAQNAVVVRAVNLRPNPSNAQPAIALLEPPAPLAVLDPAAVNGYLHVRTEDGKEGWVWTRNIHVESGTPAPPAVADGAPVPAPAGSTTAAMFDEIDPTWLKPAPNQTTFHIGSDTCGPSGQGDDIVTNLRKNRTDEPGSYRQLSYHGVADLEFPKGAPRSRDDGPQFPLHDRSNVADVNYP